MKKFVPLIIIVLLLIVIRNISISIFNSSQGEGISEKLEKQIKDEEKRQIYLQERLYQVEREDFIEKEAKEKLGYLRPGEYFVIAPTEAPINDEPIEVDIRPNWKKWYELFF